MKAKLYIDTITDTPILQIQEETLTDGSTVHNLVILNEIEIPCISESSADKAFERIHSALKKCTNDNVVVF
jgi:hypothetical protein